jgi:hypothetical protein
MRERLLEDWDAAAEHPANRALRLIAELTGLVQPRTPVRGSMISAPAAYFVSDEHYEFVAWLIRSLEEFGDYPIEKWNTLNHLLLLGGEVRFPRSRRLDHDPAWVLTNKAPFLASIVGFGLIEYVAMLRTGIWDNLGKVLVEVRNPRVVDNGKLCIYKPGRRITNLRHKLVLLDESLGVTRDAFIALRDKLTKDWGRPQPTDHDRDVYDRLTDTRNRLMHGSSNEGWEGWLLTLISFVVYADHLMSEQAL